MISEVRGRGDQWKVYYPNEERLASPFPVYDEGVNETWRTTYGYGRPTYTLVNTGNYKTTLYCGSLNGQSLTEAHFVGSESEAVEYARFLIPGCEVSVVRTLSKSESLARAREARNL